MNLVLIKFCSVLSYSVLAMAYTLVIVKDSRKLREARLAREAAKLASKDPKHVSEDGVTEKLYPNLKEETEIVVPDKSRRGCRALFDLTNIKEGLAAVLKDRPQHKRTFLLIMILIFEIEIFVIVGIIDYIILRIENT